jgi:hypothetical protein
MFGGGATPSPGTDIFGGSNDLFGSSIPLATSFPQFLAFEDEVIQLGYDFKRDPS